MEKVVRNMINASMVEIACLPIFLYINTMEQLQFLFWVLVIGMDAYKLKRMPFFEIIKLASDENYKKERRCLLFMQVGFLVGLSIVALKDIQLAGILLLNDILVDFLCFFQAMNEKKNK